MFGRQFEHFELFARLDLADDLTVFGAADEGIDLYGMRQRGGVMRREDTIRNAHIGEIGAGRRRARIDDPRRTGQRKPLTRRPGGGRGRGRCRIRIRPIRIRLAGLR